MYYPVEVYLKAAELAGIPENQRKYICSLLDGAKELLDEKSFKFIPKTPQSLIDKICECQNVTLEDLLINNKKRILVDTRAVCAVILSEIFHNIQLKEIGWLLRRSSSDISYYLIENKRCGAKQKIYAEIRNKLNL